MRRTVAGFAAAAAVLAGFLWAVDPAGIWAGVRTADPVLFAVGFPSVLLALACWNEAYRRLFRAAGADLAAAGAAGAYGTSTFAKQVVPMGHVGGPAVVAYAYHRAAGFGYDRSLAVATLGELMALVTSVALALAGAGALAAGGSTADRRVFAAAAIALAAAGLAALAVVVYRRRTVERLVHGVARLVRGTLGRVSGRTRRATAPDDVDHRLTRYYRTLDDVTADRSALLAGLAFTGLGWVCFAVPLYTCALAVGADLPLAAAFLLVPVAGLATVVPVPGGLGGYEMALTGGLVVFGGVDATLAAAAVLLYRLPSYWFLVLVGGLATASAPRAAVHPDGEPVVGGDGE